MIYTFWRYYLSEVTESLRDSLFLNMCGIFAIYSQDDHNAARQIFFALMALQHRGQEAAGIAVSNGTTLNYKKDNGMVSQIFRERHLAELPGRHGIGHTRYSTTINKNGGKQPYQFASKFGPFAIAHNGQISNYQAVKERLMKKGVCFFTESDSELLAHYISRSNADNWEQALEQVVSEVPGAYSLVVLTNEGVWAIRDPLGLRLLSVGRKNDDWVLASESCCFNVVDAVYHKDVAPGSVVHIGPDGYTERPVRQLPLRVCAFEHVYFSRPDSIISGEYVNNTRQKLGAELARQTMARFQQNDDYIVSGVPESATPMAIGYANTAKIPFNEIFAKNRYIHRTFIKPINAERKSAVYLKFNPLTNNIIGKKIILVDDSIVRGNTIRHLVDIIRKAGALEIHVMIGCPPIHYPCYMGIDMKAQDEFIMNNKTPKEVAADIGADSLTFLELDRMLTAIGSSKLCTACWTGVYPKELEW